jgi:hypothetical protein
MQPDFHHALLRVQSVSADLADPADRYHQIRVDDLGRTMRINAERQRVKPDGIGVEMLEYPDFIQLLRAS